MILYHGSNADFTDFQIQTSKDKSLLKEGYGIYMIDNKDFAKSYGSIVYSVEFNDNDLIDFTSERVVIALINKLSKQIKINLSRFIDVQDVSEGVVDGFLSSSELVIEIINLLDSNENFYSIYQNKIDNGLFDTIKECYNNLMPSIIKYYDVSFDKDVYICTKNESNVLQITGKEILK